MTKLKEMLSGKKVYLLMGVGALAAILQFVVGVDFQIAALPVAHNAGELFSELWAFATLSGFRAAIGKSSG